MIWIRIAWLGKKRNAPLACVQASGTKARKERRARLRRAHPQHEHDVPHAHGGAGGTEGSDVVHVALGADAEPGRASEEEGAQVGAPSCVERKVDRLSHSRKDRNGRVASQAVCDAAEALCTPVGMQRIGRGRHVRLRERERPHLPLRCVARLVVHDPPLKGGAHDDGRGGVGDGHPRESEAYAHQVVSAAPTQREGRRVGEGVEVIALASRGIPEAVADRIPVADGVCPPALDGGGEGEVALTTSRDAGPARGARVAAAAAVGVGGCEVDFAAIARDPVAVGEAREAGKAAAARRAGRERVGRRRAGAAREAAGIGCVVADAYTSAQVEAREAGEAAASRHAGGHRVEHGGAGVAAGSAVGGVHLRVDAGSAARRLAGRAARRARARTAERRRGVAGGAAAAAVGGRACERGLAAGGRVAIAVAEARVAGDDGAGPCYAGGRSVGDGADAPAGPAVAEVGRDARASPDTCGLPRHGARRVCGDVADVR